MIFSGPGRTTKIGVSLKEGKDRERDREKGGSAGEESKDRRPM